ncbi:unnamed protein product [Cuscuta epithymum]|uniref:X8 domain-containing protein n=1 Tax=Cuscuta epithymum TaxID=186058 RepID=A0AAV0FIJ4_9ASTE|nr:unnamed protein product [Cuscuta epithymum]CAH9135478.1 unnamed protein product [Cuscuta epithymum]
MKKMRKSFSASSLIITFFALLWTRWPGAAAEAAAGKWCVARSDADVGSLQSALQWACGNDPESCRGIQQTGSCSPSNDDADLVERASLVFHSYYLKNDMASESCNFSNTATVTPQEPNYDGCKFPSYIDGNIVNGAPGPNPDVSNTNSIRYGR